MSTHTETDILESFGLLEGRRLDVAGSLVVGNVPIVIGCPNCGNLSAPCSCPHVWPWMKSIRAEVGNG